MLTNLKSMAHRAFSKDRYPHNQGYRLPTYFRTNTAPAALLIETGNDYDYGPILTLLISQDSKDLLLAPITVREAHDSRIPVTDLLLMPKEFVLGEYFFGSAEAALAALNQTNRQVDDDALINAVTKWCSDEDIDNGHYSDTNLFEVTAIQPLSIIHLGRRKNPLFSIDRLRQVLTSKESGQVATPRAFMDSLMED